MFCGQDSVQETGRCVLWFANIHIPGGCGRWRPRRGTANGSPPTTVTTRLTTEARNGRLWTREDHLAVPPANMYCRHTRRNPWPDAMRCNPECRGGSRPVLLYAPVRS